MQNHKQHKRYMVAYPKMYKDLYDEIVGAGWTHEGFSSFTKRAVIEKAERMLVLTKRKVADVEGPHEG